MPLEPTINRIANSPTVARSRRVLGRTKRAIGRRWHRFVERSSPGEGPSAELTEKISSEYPELRRDPERAMRWLHAGQQLERQGLAGLTDTIDDWGRFARFSPPGHFYSPIPDYSSIVGRAEMIFDRFPEQLKAIDLNESQQEALFLELADVMSDEEIPNGPTDGWRYHGGNGFYGLADGLILQGMLRRFGPRRIVEVGSGWSSALMLDTIDRYDIGTEQIDFIEPYPDRLNELLRSSDESRAEIHERPVQTVDRKVFSALQRDDLLFIDSSHVVTIGSDVPYLAGEILPMLSSGVIVHIHDIFWPFEIRRDWFEDGRVWAEPYLWHAFMSSNSDWEIVFFNHWFMRARREMASAHLPRVLESDTGSLWLRRR